MYYDEDNFEEFSKHVKEKGLPDQNPDPDHELISFNEGNEIEFDLKDSKDLKEVELLSFFTLPSFFSFGLSNYQEYSEVAFKYILNSIPCPTKAFYVQNKTETIEDCTPIFLSLTCAASYCTEYFSLNYLKISCSQFCSLIKAAKRAENIRLAYCAIITDTECDFGKMEGTKVRKLNFAWSDHQYYSDWVMHRERLANIMEGIDKCEALRNSLQIINLSYVHSNDDEEELTKEIRKYPRLDHIKFEFNG